MVTLKSYDEYLWKTSRTNSFRKDYKEGDPNFLVQVMFNSLIPTDSTYYPNRFLIEENQDNTFHIHYRDVRIHLSQKEFKQIASAFVEAAQKFVEKKENLFPNLKEEISATIDINYVQPYDESHKPMAIDKEHREGIEYVKTLIQEGKRIRPILITPEGQRKDGFKRYMAFKELGYNQIHCIVSPWAEMGGQHGQSFEED